MRVPFALGRLTTRSTEIVVVDRQQEPPIPGPWTLQALVRTPRVLRLLKV